MSLMAGTAQRYAHLLEPIRDLAQNWSIDIANELEEYLTELQTITISFEDGKQLDFAEAALLIQGSACVYSRKVESLYTLVYNTLNQVVEKKRKEAEGAAGAEGAADAAECEEEDEEAFLTIEDKIKEVDNISLPPPTSAGARARDTRAFTLASAPLALLKSGGTERDDETACKMHECSLHASGALLLPHVHVPPHVLAALPAAPSLAYFTPLPDAAAATASSSGADDATMADGDDDDDDNGIPAFDDADDWQEALDAPPPPVDATAAPPPATAAVGSPSWAAVMAGTDGTADPADEPAPPTPLPAAARAAAAAGGTAAAATRPTGGLGGVTLDPWAPLDPHEPSGARRPFRRGKTYSAPPTEEAEVAAAAVGAANVAGSGEGAADDLDDPEDDADGEVALAGGLGAGGGEGGSGGKGEADVLRRLGLLPWDGAHGSGAASPTSVLVPLRSPLWPQFDSLHVAASKSRAAARRLRRAEAAQWQHLAGADADAAEVEADALVRPSMGAAGGASGGGVDGVDGAEGGDGAAFGDEYAEDDGPMGGGFDDDDFLAEAFPEEVLGGTAPLASSAASAPRLSLGGGATASYEEMCRAHVESCLEASSSYHDDFELHRRVADWSSKVEPLLANESRRDEFDIYEYAERLLSNFDASERSVGAGKKQRRADSGSSGSLTSAPFEELAAASEPFEVCRMFLATLQLTNNGNVDLATSGTIEGGDLSLTVNLLSRERRQIEV